MKRQLIIRKGCPLSEYEKYQNEMKTTFAIQSQKERNIRRVTKKSDKFSVELIGYDGTLKKKWNTWPGWKTINSIVDTMPMRKVEINYSLYSDDNPKRTIPGLGFKNETTARKSIQYLKESQNMTNIQKRRIVNVLIQRAKYHPHSNSDMRKAIRLYEQFYKLLEVK